ncbi:MAG: AAA family ATPase [Victivallaceae bacterium]|nr:AAA family ATPase [Victivallaceae bacterium]
MKRKIYDQLVRWKRNDAQRTAMLIDGARRVGKSFIAEEFAKNEYSSYILVDFNKAGNEVKELFDHHLNDLDTFFSYLSAYFNTRLIPGKSLIVFDEVQLYPRAVPPSNILSRTEDITILKPAPSCRSRRMSMTSSSHPKNDISRCIRWISRNSSGRSGTRP